VTRGFFEREPQHSKRSGAVGVSGAASALARVVAAATISNFGSMLTRLALPFVAVDALGASAGEMSALSAARLVPGSRSGSRSPPGSSAAASAA